MDEEGVQETADFTDEAILRELCTVSGCNYERLLEAGKDEDITKIEIFFFGFPRISGLQHFPNLTVLCIVNQPIRSLAGLESCDKLKELWVCETQINSMQAIEGIVGLVQLYLYSNQINQIGGLDRLVKLEKLWLNGNRISSLGGLGNQSELRDLNLASNCIEMIDDDIERLTKLEILDLSGNQISSFEDLAPLSHLSHLHSLSLSHPHHPPNPLSLLCNYSTLMLFSFPHLTSLDGQDVTSTEVKKLVQGLVAKKKMYYRMSVKHEKEMTEKKCHAHQQEVKQIRETIFTRLKSLHIALKQLQDVMSEGELEEEYKKKIDLISERMVALTTYQNHVDQISTNYEMMLMTGLDRKIQLCEIELGSGGNVKFTSSGGPTGDQWYRACVELVKSRFSPSNWLEFGFFGIEVCNVLRIENRKLHHRLLSTVHTILQQQSPDSIPPHKDISELIEYLFLVWNPEMDIYQISRYGFHGYRPPIQLTDSIMLADSPRLKHSRGCGQSSDGRGHRSHTESESELLLCKVFKGKSCEVKNSGIPTASQQPSMHSVYHYHANGHSCEWFSFHSSLVVPVFVISVCYQTGEPLQTVMDHMMSCDPHTPSDDVILNQAPPLPLHPKLALLDEASLLRITDCTSLNEIKNLCLHGNHLTRFRLSSCPPTLTHSLLTSLTRLNLSCNDLRTLEDIQNLPLLIELDISFNHISTLDGLKSLPKLQELDVSWNSLSCYIIDVNTLRKHMPSLVKLDCRHNPWIKAEFFRAHIVSRLTNLKCLNDNPITDEDKTAANNYFTTSQLSPTSLATHAHTITHPTSSLSLAFTTHTIHQQQQSSSLQNCEIFNAPIKFWGPKVTSVHLVCCHIRRLTCFDQLPNLQWLCLDNNNINNIESLSMCHKLQEVSLDNNLITDLSPLCSLRQLQILSVDHNCLATLPRVGQLKSLSRLHYLSISHNYIPELIGMENLSNLKEFYASSNKIKDRRQLFHLKLLNNLVVLSLENNPLSSAPEEVGVVMGGASYRMFTAYHLHTLKALDGVPLDEKEISHARDKLGGRLTQDVIYEEYPDMELSDTRTLTLSNSAIKSVDLTPLDVMNNLVSLNLEHNSLTSFSGLIHLQKLKVLCLNHNKVECLVSKEMSCCDQSVLNSLEVLHLAYNGITNITSLDLARIPSLRALFLQGNEISRVDGLTGLTSLTELVLDRNRIKTFHEGSFSGLVQLRVLLVEENRLRSLSHLTHLINLERLFLGGNKLQDYSEIDKLHSLSRLLELSLIDNPLSRRHQHRTITIFNLSALLSLDGVRVTSQERQNAEAIFSINDEQDMVEMLLPGLPNRPAHLRVMNVPFAPTDHTHKNSDRRNHGNNRQ